MRITHPVFGIPAEIEVRYEDRVFGRETLVLEISMCFENEAPGNWLNIPAGIMYAEILEPLGLAYRIPSKKAVARMRKINLGPGREGLHKKARYELTYRPRKDAVEMSPRDDPC